MKGFAFQPSSRAKGAFTAPGNYRVQYTQPAREMPGAGLMLAGRGPPTIQSIIADEMLKDNQAGEGITASHVSYASSAPHAGHTSGGALNLAGSQYSAPNRSGGALRLAGQRMSKAGCGFVEDELPGESLKKELVRGIRKAQKKKKAEKVGGGVHRLHGIVKKEIQTHLLPALHEELNIPVLKPETYKKILDKAKTTIKDAKSVKAFSHELAKIHVPVIAKMYRRMHKGSGLFDPIEGLTPADRDNKLYALYSNLQAPIGDAFHKAVSWLVKKSIENMNRRQKEQEGGRLIKDPRKLKKMRSFFKGFSGIASAILAPVAQALGPVALEAYGVPPPVAKPLGMLASKGITGINKFVQSRPG